MGYDVMVSYAREDRELASILCNQLVAEGVQARIAPRARIMNERYIAEVSEMIKSVKIAVVLISAYSTSSGQVTRELELAVKNQLEILPVRLDDTKPSGSLGYYLSGKRWYNMKQNEAEPWETAQEISRHIQGEDQENEGKKGFWRLFKSKGK